MPSRRPPEAPADAFLERHPLVAVVLRIEHDLRVRGSFSDKQRHVVRQMREGTCERQFEPDLLEQLPTRRGRRRFAGLSSTGGRGPRPVALVLRPVVLAVEKQELAHFTGSAPDDDRRDSRLLPSDRQSVPRRLHPLILTWPGCEAHFTVPGTVSCRQLVRWRPGLGVKRTSQCLAPGPSRKDEALPTELTGLLTGSCGTALQSREGIRLITGRSRS